MTMRIDKDEYEKRLQKISTLFAGMIGHARDQARFRCPYKNRHSQCTAKFSCRHQRDPPNVDAPLLCAADDRFDYRTAWQEGSSSEASQS
jgi:hypothetical protein